MFTDVGNKEQWIWANDKRKVRVRYSSTNKGTLGSLFFARLLLGRQTQCNIISYNAGNNLILMQNTEREDNYGNRQLTVFPVLRLFCSYLLFTSRSCLNIFYRKPLHCGYKTFLNSFQENAFKAKLFSTDFNKAGGYQFNPYVF